MGDIMATKIEHPVTVVPSFEKVLSQNTQFAEKFLGAFKRLISTVSIVPENSKNEVAEATKEYLQLSLQNVDVSFPNIDQLTTFLVKHIDSIQPIIAICHEVEEKIQDAQGLKLVYEVETEDQSGAENVTLYVSVEQKTVELNEQLKAIVEPYLSYLIDSNILFTIQLS